ncbi:MAG: hypothetical protein ACRC5H_10730 [Treponemataceae bacterium]
MRLIFCVLCFFYISCASLSVTDEEEEPFFLDTVYASYKNKSVELNVSFIPEYDAVELVFWRNLKKIIFYLNYSNRQTFLLFNSKNYETPLSDYIKIFFGSVITKQKEVLLQFNYSDSGLIQLSFFLDENQPLEINFTPDQFLFLCSLMEQAALQDYFDISQQDEYIEENDLYIFDRAD